MPTLSRPWRLEDTRSLANVRLISRSQHGSGANSCWFQGRHGPLPSTSHLLEIVGEQAGSAVVCTDVMEPLESLEVGVLKVL